MVYFFDSFNDFLEKVRVLVTDGKLQKGKHYLALFNGTDLGVNGNKTVYEQKPGSSFFIDNANDVKIKLYSGEADSYYSHSYNSYKISQSKLPEEEAKDCFGFFTDIKCLCDVHECDCEDDSCDCHSED